MEKYRGLVLELELVSLLFENLETHARKPKLR